MKILRFSWLLLALFLSSCSSYVATHEPDKNLSGYQRFFVKSNFDDNHGMDGRIARALQEKGFTAEKGPLTLMPSTTQAIVHYEDHWTWDFKTHLAGLRIVVLDAKSEKPVATGTFTGPAAMTLTADEAVERLLSKIFKSTPLTAEKASSPDQPSTSRTRAGS